FCVSLTIICALILHENMMNFLLDLFLQFFLFTWICMKPFIIATFGYLQYFTHLHYTELVAVLVYKLKDYSWSFIATMRDYFFMMTFSSAKSLILSSSSFSRLRCSLGVMYSNSSAFNFSSFLHCNTHLFKVP